MKPENHIYIHVPFCLKKCSYCNFYSVPYGQSAADEYLAALACELRRRIRPASSPATIYVGGGTPTVLSGRELSRLLTLLQANLDLGELEEFTIEANPGTLSRERIEVLKDSAVDRISLGIQSFNDARLRMLGRVHSSDEATQAFESLSKAGFRNISIDLIYGVPGDSEAAWQADLDSAVALRPRHISTYCLSVEDGTPLARMVASSELVVPDDESQRSLYHQAADFLCANGYEHYELSNFGLQGFFSRHNLATWRYEPYIGLGPSAVSFDGAVRSRNTANLEHYLKDPGRPSETETPAGLQRAAEVMMLALRTREGITGPEFFARTGLALTETYGSSLKELVQRGLVEETNRSGTTAIRLTADSLFVSDEILTDFF